MIVVAVDHVSTLRIRRNHEQRNAGSVAERLHVSGIIIAAAFIERDKYRGVRPQLGIRLQLIDNLLGEPLELVQLGRSWVPVRESTRLDNRNCRQITSGDVFI